MNNNLSTLLRLIGSNADATFLLHQGLTYSQISELFSTATKSGFIFHDGNSFSLTVEGKDYLKSKPVMEKYGKIGVWVSSDDRSRIPQIAVNEVFLPKLSESKFLIV